MEKIKANNQLDCVLKCLEISTKLERDVSECGVNHDDLSTFDDLLNYIKAFPEINRDPILLKMALEYLIKEGLIKYEQCFKDEHVSGYRLLFAGKILIQNGGFSQKYLNSNLSRNKANRNEWMISRGALFAAAFAGALLILELVKFFCKK